LVTVALCKMEWLGSPAAADDASNIPANPTSRFILRSFPQTGQFNTKAKNGRLRNRGAVTRPLNSYMLYYDVAGRRPPAAPLAGVSGSAAAAPRKAAVP
jgi:hypothetical protein